MSRLSRLWGWALLMSCASAWASVAAAAETARWFVFSQASSFQTGHDVASAVDTRRGRLIMFGMWRPAFCANVSCFGASDTALTTIAHMVPDPTLDAPVWLPGSPGRRSNASAAYDSLTDRVWMFGGRRVIPTPCSQDCANPPRISLDDLWWLDLSVDPPQWHETLVSGVKPAPRFDAGLVVDPIAHRLLMFGGQDSLGTYFSDVWELPLEGAPAWHQLSPTGAGPSARAEATLLIDGARSRMLVVGGANASATTADVWSMSLAGSPAWSPLIVMGSPPTRIRHAALDTRRDLVLTYASPAEIATFSLAGAPEWAPTPSVDAPPDATPGGFGYDPVNDLVWVPYAYCPELGRGVSLNQHAIFQFVREGGPPVSGGPIQLGLPGPNPAGSSVAMDIGSDLAGSALVRVFDLRGREVWSGRYAAPFRFRATLDLRGLPPGLYVIALEQGGERRTRRLVVFR
ncbi:MAG: T9SS type A sorting domain-containing protein [Candidatus Eisenbacteria bacterium]|nr:T9SS type A sorting domain-containing protein [Candidatus Eisenbacteria bacterium]